MYSTILDHIGSDKVIFDRIYDQVELIGHQLTPKGVLVALVLLKE